MIELGIRSSGAIVLSSLLRVVWLLAFGMFFIVSCKKGAPTDSSALPKADPGPNQSTSVGCYVVLDGSHSMRGTGDTIKYNWSADPSNPNYVYFESGAPRPQIGFLVAGTYKFNLVVNDGIQTSEPAEVDVIVGPHIASAFEDPHLELYVRLALQVPLGTLTDSALGQLDSLFVVPANPKMYSLKGIEKCSHLAVAQFSGESIGDITPLASLTSLTWLDIDQSWAFKDISSLSSLVNLKHLNLYGNYVSDISAVAGLKTLQYLNIAENSGIQDISVVANLFQLQELDIENSHLNSIVPISQLTQLKTLYLATCGISDITPLVNLRNLQLLELDLNQVADISPLINLTGLQVIYIMNNQITDISVLQNLPDLKVLHLMQNRITDLKPLVANPAFANGCFAGLEGNPLDSTSIYVYIPALKMRGVTVGWP